MGSSNSDDCEQFLEETAVSDYSDSLSTLTTSEPNTHLLSGEKLDTSNFERPRRSRFHRFCTFRAWYRSPQPALKRLSRSCYTSKRSLLRKFRFASYAFSALVLILTTIAFLFFPSYTHLPHHYQQLNERVKSSTDLGRGNPQQQNIFIAVSLFDPAGHLARGAWADNILQLIDLLGPEHTFLSIYENGPGPEAQLALSQLEEKVPCGHSLVFEEHLGLEQFPTITLPDGTTRVKRITYLAEVRNRALKPLENATVRYDKVLYLNDVFFDPVDALQLLFSTNMNEDGLAEYRAACAVDFINPFKFYDTFATRDLGGWGMGVPFFPWFAYGGDTRSHSDVLLGKDAVRVKACWGGMVAFDAVFFQPPQSWTDSPSTAGSASPSNLTVPYKFRSEHDLYFDASECCLIHADIQSLDPEDTGIYMNPFVRCAYDARTHAWLWFTRRFERLYTPIHFMIDILVSFPRYNPRRDEQAWEQVEESVWVPDFNSPQGGSFQILSRVADHSGFCGRRGLSVMKESFTPGERSYESVPIPSA